LCARGEVETYQFCYLKAYKEEKLLPVNLLLKISSCDGIDSATKNLDRKHRGSLAQKNCTNSASADRQCVGRILFLDSDTNPAQI